MGLLDLLFGGSKKAAYIKELYANGAVIIDVRTPDEFRSGHIKSSINIPLQTLSQKITTIPSTVTPHQLVKKVLDDRAAMGRGDIPVDWGMGEHMAFASLVAGGYYSSDASHPWHS